MREVTINLKDLWDKNFDNKKEKYKKAYFFENYKIIIEEEKIFVCHEKTNGLIDWFINVLYYPFGWFFSLFKKEPYKDMDINKIWYGHFAYILQYKSMRDVFIKDLKLAIDQVIRSTDKKPIIIVSGWSMGGGKTLVSGEDIGYTFYDKKYKPICISFGGPKIFFKKESYETVKDRYGAIILIEAEGDWLANLPPDSTNFIKPVDPIMIKVKSSFKNKFLNFFNIWNTHTAYADIENYPSEEIKIWLND